MLHKFIFRAIFSTSCVETLITGGEFRSRPGTANDGAGDAKMKMSWRNASGEDEESQIHNVERSVIPASAAAPRPTSTGGTTSE